MHIVLIGHHPHLIIEGKEDLGRGHIRGRAPKAQGRGSNFFFIRVGPDFSKQGGPGGVPSKIFSQIS